jgi:hypothetical protein
MREYVAGTGQASQYIRMLVGGKISSGKTSFAATAPSPLFLADYTEGGAAVLDKMDPRLWWDPKVIPAVWAMESKNEWMQHAIKLQGMCANGKPPVVKGHPRNTLVVDSLSIFSQAVLRDAKLERPDQDGRQRYGDLGDLVSLFLYRIHSLPMHVIWLCHVDDNYNLVVAGKAATAAWAYMSYKLLVRADVNGEKVNYQLQTKPFRTATWIGQGRVGQPLPNPMIPSFKCLAELFGLPEKPVSPSLPPFGGIEYWDGASYL